MLGTTGEDPQDGSALRGDHRAGAQKSMQRPFFSQSP